MSPAVCLSPKGLPIAIALFLACPLFGQTITHQVSFTPTVVSATGLAEVLGEIRLTQTSPGGGSQTTTASTVRLTYNVPITNLFVGRKAVDLATSTISDVGGITISLSGGYGAAGIAAEVANLTVGDNVNGVLTLIIPQGLTISQGDQIRVNGVRGDVTALNVSDTVTCLLSAAPSSSHSFLNLDVIRVGLITDNSLKITTSELPDAFLAMDYHQTLSAAGGVAPYSWRVVSGVLPIPMFLNPHSGEIVGGPAQGGSHSFVVEVEDSIGSTTTRAFVIRVQGIQSSHAGIFFSSVPVGSTSIRRIHLTNVGTATVQVSSSLTGHAAFSVPMPSFSLEAGEAREVEIAFTPSQAEVGRTTTGYALFQIPGFGQSITLSGTAISAPFSVSLLPRSGPTVGNTRIRIIGLTPDTVTSVRLGGVPLTDLSAAPDGTLLGTSGPHEEGTVDLSLDFQDGQNFVVAGRYRYQNLPAVVPSPGDLRVRFVADTPELRSNLGINNVGEVAASVAVSWIDNNGLLVAQKTVSVPAHGLRQIDHIGRFLEDEEAATGREGYLLLSSTQPIEAWSSQVDNLTQDPSLQVAARQGASRLVIPSSVANARFRTAVMIVNLRPIKGTVDLTAFTPKGTAQAVVTHVDIAAGGFLYISDFYRTAGLQSGVGPIEIEGSEGLELAALARVDSIERTSGYFEAVPAQSAAKEVWIPFSTDTDAFRTNLGIQNRGSIPAQVTIALFNMGGLTEGSFVATLETGELFQWNDINRVLLNRSGITQSNGWLQIQSSEEAIAWTSLINNATQDPGFTVGRQGGSTRLLIPSATSVGRFRSNLVVVNASPAPNLVVLTAYSPEGDIRESAPITLPGHGFIVYDDLLGSLGLSGSFGPVELVSLSEAPLLAISRVDSGQGTSGTFDALSQVQVTGLP
ncbi:MAG: putative Ig domain-containing protein [Acidobacteriota bacterium]